ncbi:MAG: hypothetical protein AAGL19_06995 [Pseudomonadota bacterium]
MTHHTFLESFDHSATEAIKGAADTDALEAEKAKAFEAGYASGWDDAIASDKTSRLHLEAEFERNIQNLAFTFAEAVTHVRSELEELLNAIIDHFLPRTAPEALKAHIRSELLQMGDDLTEVKVEIVASPDCNATVADMLKSDFSLDIQPIEDASLAAGQVFLRLGKREVEVNLEPLIRAVSGQLAAMNEGLEGKGTGNG